MGSSASSHPEESWTNYVNSEFFTGSPVATKLCKMGVPIATGGGAFVLCTSVGQALQGVLSISSGVRVLPSILGFGIVCGGSVVSGKVAGLTSHAMQGKSIFEFEDDLGKQEMVRYALCGTALFLVFGGKFRGLAPSDYRLLGSFSQRRASLPATLEYATSEQRAVINSFGRLFGCHTCGARRRKFHADHMPPVHFVKRANAALWCRVLRLKPATQRFYPQCGECSNKQAVAVKRDAAEMAHHFFSLRLYHLTGAVVCTLLFQQEGISKEGETTETLADTVVEVGETVVDATTYELNGGLVGARDTISNNKNASDNRLRRLNNELEVLRGEERVAQQQLKRIRRRATPCSCELKLVKEVERLKEAKARAKRAYRQGGGGV